MQPEGVNTIFSLHPRLKTTAGLVPVTRCVADIGTDHALLPLYLIGRGVAARAIAVEKKAGPAAAARRAVAAAGLEERIEVRTGDGLAALSAGEVQVIVIAGLGGETIAAILEAGAATARDAGWLVLQPMNRAAFVRRWLAANGWRIEAEELVEERKRLYQAIAAAPGGGRELSRLEEEAGPVLLSRGHPLLGRLLESIEARYRYELEGLYHSVREETEARKEELLERLAEIRRVTARICNK
ncbi:MAG: class I SAM-dependent methyltransferase [Bacillota bacterium]